MDQRVIFYTVFVACAMLGAAQAGQATAASAATRPSHSQLDTATVDQLKRTYLECEKGATERMLDSGEAALCSMVHEALKERGFGGDFERMLAWWRSERSAVATAPRH